LENRKPILQAGKTEDIEKMAKEWASIIKNKEARKDAEDAARIILEHGIKLPRLLKKKGGKTSGAEYRAPMFEGDDGILYFNELRERDYKSYKEKKMQYRSGAQDNTFLHELGHHIDALLEPKAYSMVEHQWNMEKVNRELIEKELSRYALENRAEFEAELISATLRGKTFSKELLSYSNLHNPEQNEGIAKALLQYASGKDICTPVDLVREKFDRMMKVLFRQEGASLEIGILASEEAQDFIETHSSVLNGSFRQVEMSEAMRKRLERSNYIFSGLKTFHELNEAFPSLLDENGNRKTFERFLNDVRKIDETYNSNYLRAEFNFVQASAEMAAKWERFMQDGDRYYLQYRTAGDAKVRPTHAEMAGITLPASDPFWEEFYPPNGWGCRCSVVQVRKSKYPATDHEEAMARGESALELDKKGMFRFNAGMEQKTMPDYNPYTIKRCKDCDIAKGKLKLAKNPIPDNELCEACQKIHQCWAKRKEEEPETFTQCETKNGILRVSSKHGKTEKKENVRVGTYLAEKHGYEIDLIANPPDRKSADSFNNTLGVFQEYKVNVTPTKNSIDNLIRDAKKQADDIVLWIDSDISLGDLRDAITSRVKRAGNIKSLTIVNNGKDVTYLREDMIKDTWEIKQADFK
jgi:SPP1 gp7 family putative phage head morphogenesis protein